MMYTTFSGPEGFLGAFSPQETAAAAPVRDKRSFVVSINYSPFNTGKSGLGV